MATDGWGHRSRMRAGSERTAQSTHSLVVDAGAVAGGGAHERCGREGVERREEGEHLVANFLHPFDRLSTNFSVD